MQQSPWRSPRGAGHVKPAAFAYVRPRALEEACEILAASDGARLIAGGQSLGPMLNLRLARPEMLVDIARLDELTGIVESETSWRIGAGVTHADLEDSADLLSSAPMLVEVAAGIAYRSIRNLGTVGGALAHADPAADWPLALAALDATVQVRGRGHQARRVKADRFMRSAFTTDLSDAEMIEFVEVPKHAGSYGYCKFCRKEGEYPQASAAAVLDGGAGVMRVFIGALSGAPQPLPALAADVARAGQSVATRQAVRAAVAEAAPGLDALSASMHAAVVARAISQAFAA